MHKLMAALDHITTKMAERLDEATVEELEEFVEQRDVIVTEVQRKGISEEDRLQYRELIQRLLVYDDQFMSRMEALKQEAQQGMNKTNTARVQKNAYDKAYSADSYFFDKKK